MRARLALLLLALGCAQAPEPRTLAGLRMGRAADGRPAVIVSFRAEESRQGRLELRYSPADADAALHEERRRVALAPGGSELTVPVHERLMRVQILGQVRVRATLFPDEAGPPESRELLAGGEDFRVR